jgi:hypothetical protein
MRQMGYTSCKADPNLWLKAVTRPEDMCVITLTSYAMLTTYCVYTMTLWQMGDINKYLPLKPSSVGNPDIYLSTKLKETRLPNGVMAWGLSSSKYIIHAVKKLPVALD